MTKDLHLTLQIRNNLLRKRRVEIGMTNADLCRATGIGEGIYGKLERLLISPFGMSVLRVCRIPECSNGANFPQRMLCKKHKATPDPLPPLKITTKTWRKEVLNLAAFYQCEPAALFPADVLCVEESTFEKEIDLSKLSGLLAEPSSSMDPEKLLQIEGVPNCQREELIAAVATLSPRLRDVVEMKFGLNGDEPKTSRQVGEQLGICGARVCKLEQDALRKLRHPSRSNRLRETLNG